MLLPALILFALLVFLIINHNRISKLETKQQNAMSLIQLAEFEGLSADVKEFYKSIILKSWVKTFNEMINKQFDELGISEYYKDNKDKLIELNQLYLEIASLSLQKTGKINNTNYRVLLYNADLDKLTKEAKETKVQLENL